MKKKVVGLTGGIASGKSTVAKAFERHGVAVVDADQIARDVVEPGTPGLAKIVETFGRDVLTADGHLDRKKLGDLVFRDAEARAALNAITHPLIALAGIEKISSYAATDVPYVIYEAALLVETGGYKGFDALVVVAVTPETQLSRLVGRDGAGEEDARARIASQMPMERKIAVADYVIRNDGPLEEAAREVARVHAALLERFGLVEK
ncbi:MAG: dephospho-CoA kinase [Polyangiales bacterium]